MPQKRSNLLLWIIVGGGTFLFIVLCLLAVVVYLAGEGSPGLSLSSNQIAYLELDGVISDSKEFVDQLKDYGKRAAVKSVVIHINSPGGGVAASQEIYEAVKKFRAETKKKVVVSMGSVAASGGYYVACGADKIFANPGTITGSIGVIAEWYNYGDLLQWAKMQDVHQKRHLQRCRLWNPTAHRRRKGLFSISDQQHVQPIRCHGRKQPQNER